MELHRRAFLFGLGATLAAVTVPLPEPEMALVEIPPVPSLLWRNYFDIMVCGMDPSYRDVIDIKVLRGETPIFHMPMPANASWRWVAPVVQGILVSPDEYLDIRVSRPENIDFALQFKEMREGWNEAKTFVERYQFGQPRAILPLEVLRNDDEGAS